MARSDRDDENVSERLPSTEIEAAALRPAISELLLSIPTTWMEFDFDVLTERQSDALLLLTAAGMVERRGWLRTTIANHPICFELRFQATGEGGLINALEHANAVEYAEWRDAWLTWNMGEAKGRSPFLVQAMKPQEWRLTSQGELARDDLREPNPAVFDFVLKRGIFGPGYWLRRRMKGRPLSAEEQASIDREIAAGHDPTRLSRPAVAGSGQLLEHRKVEKTNASQAVNLTNWNEGASAFAEAFGKLLDTTLTVTTNPPDIADRESAEEKGRTSPTVDAGRTEAPTAFRGGELAFQPERVTLCGVEICSGSRSQTKRRILELLAKKQSNGTYVAYSGEQLAELLQTPGGDGTVQGAIRDLREDISEALGKTNITCGRMEVILSGGRGYRFADCISVPSTPPDVVTDIADIREIEDVRNVRDDDVRNVVDVLENTASSRRAWILQQLSQKRPLRAPDVAGNFSCSLKTAQRDLKSLKDEGKVEFIGATNTGYYRLRPTQQDGR